MPTKCVLSPAGDPTPENLSKKCCKFGSELSKYRNKYIPAAYVIGLEIDRADWVNVRS